MKLTNSYSNCFYCKPDSFNNSCFNFINDYFNLTNQKFEIIDTKTNLGERNFQVVKLTIPKDNVQNFLKIVSYLTIALPILMFIGRLIINRRYSFMDVSNDFLSNSQMKLIEKEGKNIPITDLNLSQIGDFFYDFSIYQIEKWLISYKLRLIQANRGEAKFPEDYDSSKYRELSQKFLDRSLTEWLNDPEATGDKDFALKDINACRNGSQNSIHIIGKELNKLPLGLFLIENITILDFSQNQIKELPEGIGCFTNLVSCVFQRNKIAMLPESIKNLKKIKLLDLSENPIKNIELLTHLSSLEKLYLDCCELEYLPESIGELTNLAEFNLKSNKLSFLPKSIGELTNLTEFNLQFNKLSFLPESFVKLQALIDLALSNNTFETFPDQICELEFLERLYFAGNKITNLPRAISKLRYLKTLFLYSNNLSWLPDEIVDLSGLERLDLSYNKLLRLPDQISLLWNLKNLRIEENPKLTELPKSITDIAALKYLIIEGTGIDQRKRGDILLKTAELREKNSLLPLGSKLNTLFILGKSSLKPEDFEFLSENDKEVLLIWLGRLVKATEFKARTKEIAQVVCNMLESVRSNLEFRRFFFDQVYHNNTGCSDRTSIALEELFLTWTLKTQLKDLSFKDLLLAIRRGAKTHTLLRLVNLQILEHEKKNNTILQESTEHFLYYLIEAERTGSVELLSCIKNMKYRNNFYCHNKKFINKTELFKKTNEDYGRDFDKVQVFQDLLQNKNFREEYKDFVDGLDEIDQKSHEALNVVVKNETEWDYKLRSDQINIERENNRSDLIMKFLSTIE